MFLKGEGSPSFPYPTSCWYTDTLAPANEPLYAQVGEQVTINMRVGSERERAGKATSPHVSRNNATAKQVEDVYLVLIGPGEFVNGSPPPPEVTRRLQDRVSALRDKMKGLMNDTNPSRIIAGQFTVVQPDENGEFSVDVLVWAVGPIVGAVVGYSDGPPGFFDYFIINPFVSRSCFAADIVATLRSGALVADDGESVDVNVILLDLCGGRDTAGVFIQLATLGPVTTSRRLPDGVSLPPHFRKHQQSPAASGQIWTCLTTACSSSRCRQTALELV